MSFEEEQRTGWWNMDAEIKSLNAEIYRLEDQIQKLAIQRESDKKLVTELADALDAFEPYLKRDLIKRAREATK